MRGGSNQSNNPPPNQHQLNQQQQQRSQRNANDSSIDQQQQQQQQQRALFSNPGEMVGGNQTNFLDINSLFNDPMQNQQQNFLQMNQNFMATPSAAAPNLNQVHQQMGRFQQQQQQQQQFMQMQMAQQMLQMSQQQPQMISPFSYPPALANLIKSIPADRHAIFMDLVAQFQKGLLFGRSLLTNLLSLGAISLPELQARSKILMTTDMSVLTQQKKKVSPFLSHSTNTCSRMDQWLLLLLLVIMLLLRPPRKGLDLAIHNRK